jgi:hypothetical protein
MTDQTGGERKNGHEPYRGSFLDELSFADSGSTSESRAAVLWIPAANPDDLAALMSRLGPRNVIALFRAPNPSVPQDQIYELWYWDNESMPKLGGGTVSDNLSG